jgi:hypothetical protein
VAAGADRAAVEVEAEGAAEEEAEAAGAAQDSDAVRASTRA